MELTPRRKEDLRSHVEDDLVVVIGAIGKVPNCVEVDHIRPQVNSSAVDPGHIKVPGELLLVARSSEAALREAQPVTDRCFGEVP